MEIEIPCHSWYKICYERSDEMTWRNLFVGLVGLVVIAFVAAQWTGTAVDAQDSTEDRVAALETQVAGLEKRVSNHGREIDRLEDQVATLEAGTQPGETGETEPANAPADEGTSVSGVGVMVSDKFGLSPGRYKVTATAEVADFDGFIAVLYGDNGEEETLFNELIETPGTWTASTIVEVTGGDYAVGVDNSSSPWTLVFEKF
jgi:hypothetical protein